MEPMKVDRKKLYGWTEVHAFDDDGHECQLVSTDSTGTIIIPKGGIALGVTSPDGKWIERSHLTVLTEDGSEAQLKKSSYSSVTELTRKASNEDLLDSSISAIYHLSNVEDLIAAIGEDIYTFEYCYLDSYEASPAFLLVCEVGGKKELFLFVGSRNEFTFVGLDELALADDSESSEDEDDSGEIDFSMF